MLEAVKDWVINIAAVVIFMTAVEMILPSNSMKKYAKFVFGLILITVLINPIINFFNKNYNFDDFANKASGYFDQGKYSQSLDNLKNVDLKNTKAQFQLNFEDICKKDLLSKFKDNDFTVESDIVFNNKTNSFEINKLRIGVKDNQVENIKKIVIDVINNDINSKVLLNDAKSKSIKNFLSAEMKISTNDILVYKTLRRSKWILKK